MELLRNYFSSVCGWALLKKKIRTTRIPTNISQIQSLKNMRSKIFCSLETSIDGFWGPKIAKGSVRMIIWQRRREKHRNLTSGFRHSDFSSSFPSGAVVAVFVFVVFSFPWRAFWNWNSPRRFRDSVLGTPRTTFRPFFAWVVLQSTSRPSFLCFVWCFHRWRHIPNDTRLIQLLKLTNSSLA